jgi:hypothetical protein
MMTASEAAASETFVSVIAPTPRSMTRSDTSSPTSILASAVLQRLDRTGRIALEDELELLRLALLQLLEQLVERLATGGAWPAGRCTLRASRLSAIWRAMRSSSTTRKLSPAPGTDVRPSTWTGIDGGASSTVSPWSLIMARTRP